MAAPMTFQMTEKENNFQIDKTSFGHSIQRKIDILYPSDHQSMNPVQNIQEMKKKIPG